jgi:hypothetical protein
MFNNISDILNYIDYIYKYYNIYRILIIVNNNNINLYRLKNLMLLYDNNFSIKIMNDLKKLNINERIVITYNNIKITDNIKENFSYIIEYE